MFLYRAGVLLAFFSNEKSYGVLSDAVNETVVTGVEYVEECVKVDIVGVHISK